MYNPSEWPVLGGIVTRKYCAAVHAKTSTTVIAVRIQSCSVLHRNKALVYIWLHIVRETIAFPPVRSTINSGDGGGMGPVLNYTWNARSDIRITIIARKSPVTVAECSERVFRWGHGFDPRVTGEIFSQKWGQVVRSGASRPSIAKTASLPVRQLHKLRLSKTIVFDLPTCGKAYLCRIWV